MFGRFHVLVLPHLLIIYHFGNRFQTKLFKNDYIHLIVLIEDGQSFHNLESAYLQLIILQLKLHYLDYLVELNILGEREYLPILVKVTFASLFCLIDKIKKMSN